MKFHTLKEKQEKAFEAMKADFGYKNKMQAVKIKKVVISSGIGSMKDKNKKALVADRLMKITGQKPATRGAKKSIANFKLRQGEVIGYQITLRGQRMFDFLDRLLNIALPRTRDFRGIKTGSIDEMGNYSIGIKEHTIFPETSDEELKDVFGFNVTIVTSGKNVKETLSFLTNVGFPFKKGDVK